jgi:hypothetical protein
MAISSKNDICNLALGHLGNYGTISNIDTPRKQHEITFALWYDISREAFLKIAMPNFALARKRIALVSETPPYPFTYSYEYPSDCLKVLGIGAVEDKKNDYTVEANRLYTDVEYEDGLPLRYIKNITDVNSMSPEFIVGFSWYLAGNVALIITQDKDKAMAIQRMVPMKITELSGLNAQENLPIRISRSRFKGARATGYPTVYNKK